MMVAKRLLQHFMTLPDRHLMQFPEVGQIIAKPESNVVRIITITAGIPILWEWTIGSSLPVRILCVHTNTVYLQCVPKE